MDSNALKEEILLHILIPTYGESPFLKDALNSIAQIPEQNEFKVTIVDDYSPTSETENIVSEFQNLNYKFIRNEANLGLAGNFKKCLEMSKGKYTLILGSDDRVLPEIISALKLKDRENSNLDFVQIKTHIIDEHGKRCRPFVDKVKRIFTPVLLDKYPLAGNLLLASLLIGNWTYFPAIAWKTDKRDKFNWNLSLKHAVDLDLLCQISLTGARMMSTSETGVEYRRHKESQSSKLGLTTLRVNEELSVHKGINISLSGARFLPLRILSSIALTIRVHALITALTNHKADPTGSRNILKLTFSPLSRIS
jgi:glycosyltransferase involved in cell wall biosynthesis